jgi:hypothetical protein
VSPRDTVSVQRPPRSLADDECSHLCWCRNTNYTSASFRWNEYEAATIRFGTGSEPDIGYSTLPHETPPLPTPAQPY